MTYGSTFSGIGGFDLGFDQEGFTPLWQVELDRECNRILGRHWSEVERHGNIETFHAKGRRTPDVIFGGFPCQDLSVAGRRAGLAGKRSGLFHEFARVVAEFRPRFFVVENVPGLFSSNGGQDFAAIIRKFTELGYCIAWRVLDSQYFGVPQRRRRVFIVGSLGDGSAAQILFEPESVRGDSAPSRGAGKNSFAGTLRSSDGGIDADSGSAGYVIPEFVGCLEARESGKYQSVQSAARGHLIPEVAWALQERDAKGADSDTKEGHLIAFGHCDSDPRATTGETSPTLRSTMADKGHKNTSSHIAVAVPILEAGARTGKSTNDPRAGIGIGVEGDPMFSLQSGKQHAVSFAENQRAEIRGCDIAPQLSAGGGKPGSGYPAVQVQWSSGGGKVENDSAQALRAGAEKNYQFARIGMSVRRLTPRECERLQGFPDDWTRWDIDGKELSDSARYRMLGNAVTVAVARWIASRIKMHG